MLKLAMQTFRQTAELQNNRLVVNWIAGIMNWALLKMPGVTFTRLGGCVLFLWRKVHFWSILFSGKPGGGQKVLFSYGGHINCANLRKHDFPSKAVKDSPCQKNMIFFDKLFPRVGSHLLVELVVLSWFPSPSFTGIKWAISIGWQLYR